MVMQLRFQASALKTLSRRPFPLSVRLSFSPRITACIETPHIGQSSTNAEKPHTSSAPPKRGTTAALTPLLLLLLISSSGTPPPSKTKRRILSTPNLYCK